MNRRMFLLGVMLLLSACSTVTGYQQILTMDATVKHTALEGGFYYLQGEDGADYDPINLPNEYRQNARQVKVKLKVRDDLTSAHQFGIMAEILEISARP